MASFVKPENVPRRPRRQVRGYFSILHSGGPAPRSLHDAERKSESAEGSLPSALPPDRAKPAGVPADGGRNIGTAEWHRATWAFGWRPSPCPRSRRRPNRPTRITGSALELGYTGASTPYMWAGGCRRRWRCPRDATPSSRAIEPGRSPLGPVVLPCRKRAQIAAFLFKSSP
jgi:hypothetical protein